MRRWLALAVLLPGCSSAPSLSPEEAERQKAYEAAIQPCRQKYPSVREVEVDQYGNLSAEIRSNAVDWDGFKRCVEQALTDIGVTDVLLRGFPPDVDGILGANYLNHFRMTIDREGRQLVLDPVADPRQRLNRDRPL